jgi:hypothetical protein
MPDWREIIALFFGDSRAPKDRISKGRFRVVAGRYAHPRPGQGSNRRTLESKYRRRA